MIPQDLDKEFGIVSACVIHCFYLDAANKNDRELLPKCKHIAPKKGGGGQKNCV